MLHAQVIIKGTVYDSLGRTPVPAVSVLTSRMGGTVTNNNGAYTIQVSETDSVWFSYLGKPTRRFAVKDIATPYAFDISLKINIPILETVKVRQRNYRQDSIENRNAYAKIFDYQRPTLKAASGDVGYGGAAGFDLDEIINAFRFKRNRSMLAFQSRLINQEQEQYVRHRFSKALVRRLTPLDDDSTITTFINLYMPSYLFTAMACEYRFQEYIKRSYERYSKGIGPSPLWLEGETRRRQDF